MTETELRLRAWRYRRMSEQFSDQKSAKAILAIADEYEAIAEQMAGRASAGRQPAAAE